MICSSISSLLLSSSRHTGIQAKNLASLEMLGINLAPSRQNLYISLWPEFSQKLSVHYSFMQGKL